MEYCKDCKQTYADDDPNGCICTEEHIRKKWKGIKDNEKNDNNGRTSEEWQKHMGKKEQVS